jgi:hypothetical protein
LKNARGNFLAGLNQCTIFKNGAKKIVRFLLASLRWLKSTTLFDIAKGFEKKSEKSFRRKKKARAALIA